MIATTRGDYFEWRIAVPSGTWTGLTASCCIRSRDRSAVIYTFSPVVTINGDGTATVANIASKAATRNWSPGTYRIDCELEQPGVWGPFTVTPSSDDVLQVTADDTQTTA